MSNFTSFLPYLLLFIKEDKNVFSNVVFPSLLLKFIISYQYYGHTAATHS